MIIAHQPRRDYDIAFLEPVVHYLDVWYVLGPFRGIDIAASTMVEIVIAGDKIESVECCAKFFQGAETVLQGLHVDRSTVMAPVAKEHAGLATLRSSSGDEPVYESLTVLIVQQAVAFQA